jgi:hypothetical protein
MAPMVKPSLPIAVLLGLVAPAAAQPAPPDFSVLRTTPGTVGDRDMAKSVSPGAEQATGRKRRLHLEGAGVGYDIDDRLTLKGGFRFGTRPDESGAGAGSTGPGVYVGIRRSLGRP